MAGEIGEIASCSRRSLLVLLPPLLVRATGAGAVAGGATRELDEKALFDLGRWGREGLAGACASDASKDMCRVVGKASARCD
jgi:hypothetical protein